MALAQVAVQEVVMLSVVVLVTPSVVVLVQVLVFEVAIALANAHPYQAQESIHTVSPYKEASFESWSSAG